MSEANEPSGSHRAPDSADAPIRVPRSMLVVIIAALVGGGGGSGLTALAHGIGNSTDSAVVVALAQINSRLDNIAGKLDDKGHILDDHEKRIRDLEERLPRPH